MDLFSVSVIPLITGCVGVIVGHPFDTVKVISVTLVLMCKFTIPENRQIYFPHLASTGSSLCKPQMLIENILLYETKKVYSSFRT